MNKNASRRASPNRDTINHSSYGKTTPVEVAREIEPRHIPSKQNKDDPAIEPCTKNRSGYRELTNELCLKNGVVYLTEAGMRNLEVGLRKRNTPPERIQEYFESY